MQTVVSKIGNSNLILSVLSLMWLLSTNLAIYKFSFSVHGINMRHKLKLHKPSTKLTVYPKGLYYSSIKINNKIPDLIADLVVNKKCFIMQLKKYLIVKPFLFIRRILELLI
jgi:hypothetical protein